MHASCQKIGVDYNEILRAAQTQGAMGQTHLSAPGADGKFGYSGSCFPKDVQALLSIFPEMTILKEAHEYNETLRPHDVFCQPIHKDWASNKSLTDKDPQISEVEYQDQA
jgi:UDP-glucose 6-dehydrogenase